MPDDQAPYILTLRLDPESQARLDAWREAYFPPERNYLQAHVTLFHALPAELEEDLLQELEAIAREYEPYPVKVTEVKSMGKGVAVVLHSKLTKALHRRLQQRYREHLTPQDAQGLWLHVTVQNKVTPAEAKATLRELEDKFEPWEARATGLRLWRYRGGPWEAVCSFAF